MKKRWIVVAVSLAIVAAATAGLLLRRQGPVNLLLVSIDTLRADHLGCYGYPAAKTPNLDRLSRAGITFDEAICAAPLTLPSHSTLLTGLSPVSHGVRDNANFKLADDFVTLAEVLRANGYSTGAAVGAYILDARFGLNQGFTYYDDDLSAGRQPSLFGYPERTADKVTDSAIRWLGGVKQPFFFFAHYYDVHAPYEPPQAFASLFPGHPYDGEIAYTDSEIGRLLAYLDGRKMLKHTLVAIVADHGEGLGEHGENTHGILLYEGTLRVPLIIRPPEGSRFTRGGAGKHIAEPVSLMDVFPTLLEMLGYEQMGSTDGRSLVPAIQGKRLEPKPLYFESMSSYFAYRWSPLRGVRFNQWKYILGPNSQLYNLADDPAEDRNLAQADTAQADRLRAAVLAAASEEPGTVSPQARISAADAQNLRALGYVSPSPAEVPPVTDLGLPDPDRMIYEIAEYLEPAIRAIDEGNDKLALDKIDELIEVDPTNPEAYAHKARVFLTMNDYARARVAYEKLLQVDPKNSGAFFHLGNIAQAEEKPGEALGYYGKALEVFPDSPEALANIGSLLLTVGKTDSALAVLDRAYGIEPRNPVTLINLGLAYIVKEAPDSALVYFRKALKIEPDNVKALSNCAAIFISKGMADSAVAYFQRAHAAAPDDPRTLINLAGAYRQEGDIDAAGKAYEKALEIDPGSVLAKYGLAAVRLGQGKRDEAVALLREILLADPTFEPARLAAERLGIR
jgi:choline-sulfatase